MPGAMFCEVARCWPDFDRYALLGTVKEYQRRIKEQHELV
jgi:undecaprenyl pyrophosphate synthase